MPHTRRKTTVEKIQTGNYRSVAIIQTLLWVNPGKEIAQV